MDDFDYMALFKEPAGAGAGEKKEEEKKETAPPAGARNAGWYSDEFYRHLKDIGKLPDYMKDKI